ncbi:MAG: hypothetical protein JO154_07140 [Chitinophaga sp.]|uniref:hypothetical protein n=1 Tax=Chitinophaga sp. TaxID=1869181 RepID=UPI0025C3F191|nr:hypothetical protein [Chitinophaga sp.]MBV8252367.1 hypothetical protein [Chitinophaga sp.]
MMQEIIQAVLQDYENPGGKQYPPKKKKLGNTEESDESIHGEDQEEEADDEVFGEDEPILEEEDSEENPTDEELDEEEPEE